MYAETHGPSCRVWAYSLRTIQYSACLCVCHSSYARTNLMIWFHTSLLNSDNSYWCLGKISCKWQFLIFCYPPTMERSTVMNLSVCLRVFFCPQSYLRNYTSDLHHFFVRVTYGRDSVLLWRRSDMLRTFGFMNDVISAHKPRLLGVAAQLRRSSHAALGLAINGA